MSFIEILLPVILMEAFRGFYCLSKLMAKVKKVKKKKNPFKLTNTEPGTPFHVIVCEKI